LDFDQFPFNPVDNLVFSQLSYLPMDGLVPGPGKDEGATLEALAMHTARLNASRPASKDITVANAVSVISAVRDAPRYKNCELFGYVNHTDSGREIQFSAFCAIIGKNRSSRKLLVVYRGTDASIAGWNESFNMSFTNSVPSQKEAVLYIEKMAGAFHYPLIAAGHSKGGNLAMYASAFCDEAVQRRIIEVYSNDAPGFHCEVIQSGGYQRVCGRTRAFVPQSSFVGMLFDHGVSPTVVKSTARGIFQHDLCTWKVTRDNLSGGGELTSQSRLFNNIIREWMEKIDEKQRHQVIGALFKVVASTNASSFADLDWRNAVSIINGIKNIDGPTKKLMTGLAGDFLKTAGKNIMGKRGRKPLSR